MYFPGSTIGNLDHEEAHAFLQMTRSQVGPSGAMLVGVDLKKDARVLHAGATGPRSPTLAEPFDRPGCWDNALRPRDVDGRTRPLAPA